MANSWNDNNVVHSTQFRLLAYFRSDILENYLLGVTIANGIISEGRVWYCDSRKSSKLEDNENAANLHGRIADLVRWNVRELTKYKYRQTQAYNKQQTKKKT